MIGSYAGAALIVTGFAWLLVKLELVERARDINGVLRETLATVSNRALSDRAKERALRRQSRTLFGQFARVTAGLLLALGLPILVVWMLGMAQLWSFEGVMAASLSWPCLLAGTVLFILAAVRGAHRREG